MILVSLDLLVSEILRFVLAIGNCQKWQIGNYNFFKQTNGINLFNCQLIKLIRKNERIN